MSDTPSPVAACLTPPGSGAIAVVAVRGAGAWDVVASLFQPRSNTLPPLDQVRPGQVWLGRLGQGVADEVVLAVKRLSPEPWLEIQCHGGREVVAWLLELLQSSGVRVCHWHDLEPAASVLAHAPTIRTASILLDQVQGAFARQVQTVLAALRSGDPSGAATRLSELTRFSNVGRHLIEPWRVAVAGAVNAGKSSLVNALAGYQRSIVTPLPGTTRDVVTVRVALDGWPVELADTAGLRDDAGALEEVGIRLACDAVANADLRLWVLDASAEPLWPNADLGDVLLVVNKTDLPPAWDLDRAAGAVRVSALTGDGLVPLCEAIVARLVPEVPPAGAALPFTPDLADRLAEAEAHLTANRLAEADAVLEVETQSPALLHPVDSPSRHLHNAGR